MTLCALLTAGPARAQEGPAYTQPATSQAAPDAGHSQFQPVPAPGGSQAVTINNNHRDENAVNINQNYRGENAVNINQNY